MILNYKISHTRVRILLANFQRSSIAASLNLELITSSGYSFVSELSPLVGVQINLTSDIKCVLSGARVRAVAADISAFKTGTISRLPWRRKHTTGKPFNGECFASTWETNQLPPPPPPRSPPLLAVLDEHQSCDLGEQIYDTTKLVRSSSSAGFCSH